MQRVTGFCYCAVAIWVGLLAGAPAAGQEQDQAGRIIDRIVEGEQQFLAKMQSLHPILETYVQEFGGPDGGSLLQDHYLLGRLTSDNGMDVDGITMSARFQSPARNKKMTTPSPNQPRDYATAPAIRNKNVITLMPAGWAQVSVSTAGSNAEPWLEVQFMTEGEAMLVPAR